MNNKIKVLRKENGDTLKKLAKKINYDYSNLSKIERGIYQPSLELLEKIADIYNVNLTYFFGEDTTYTLKENIFKIGEVNLNCEDLLKKYDLMLDGKKLSKTEFKFVTEVIRTLRQTFFTLFIFNIPPQFLL
jgi:transcriptional regulator with XRE-family HTH domain